MQFVLGRELQQTSHSVCSAGMLALSQYRPETPHDRPTLLHSNFGIKRSEAIQLRMTLHDDPASYKLPMENTTGLGIGNARERGGGITRCGW